MMVRQMRELGVPPAGEGQPVGVGSWTRGRCELARFPGLAVPVQYQGLEGTVVPDRPGAAGRDGGNGVGEASHAESRTGHLRPCAAVPAQELGLVDAAVTL